MRWIVEFHDADERFYFETGPEAVAFAMAEYEQNDRTPDIYPEGANPFAGWGYEDEIPF